MLGNLRQVQQPNKTIEYVIDAKNRRVGKKVNGVLTQGFIYQGKLKPVAQLDGHGEIVARFVYASKANIPDYILKNGNTYRVISDWYSDKDGYKPESPPIEVNVNGKLLITDGHHRTLVAIKAGVKEVPVNVTDVTKEFGDELMTRTAETRVRDY
uniref:ParB N-terminal domain-containing protein n=1 Tax=Beggiatoa alba TaxID=1022 RepID=UPI0018DEE132